MSEPTASLAGASRQLVRQTTPRQQLWPEHQGSALNSAGPAARSPANTHKAPQGEPETIRPPCASHKRSVDCRAARAGEAVVLDPRQRGTSAFAGSRARLRATHKDKTPGLLHGRPMGNTAPEAAPRAARWSPTDTQRRGGLPSGDRPRHTASTATAATCRAPPPTMPAGRDAARHRATSREAVGALGPLRPCGSGARPRRDFQRPMGESERCSLRIGDALVCRWMTSGRRHKATASMAAQSALRTALPDFPRPPHSSWAVRSETSAHDGLPGHCAPCRAPSTTASSARPGARRNI